VSCKSGADAGGKTFSMDAITTRWLPISLPTGATQSPHFVNLNATEMVKVDLTQMLNPADLPVTGNACNAGVERRASSVERRASRRSSRFMILAPPMQAILIPAPLGGASRTTRKAGQVLVPVVAAPRTF